MDENNQNQELGNETTLSRKEVIANRIFWIVLVLLLISSVSATFIKIVLLKNYQIVAEVSCDPVLEPCFAYEDEETELYFYKLISKKAATIVACEATEERLGCDEELSCVEGEENCEYTYCDPENLEEGEKCAESLTATTTDDLVN